MIKAMNILAVAALSAALFSCEPLLMKADLERATVVQTKVLSWRDADTGFLPGTAPWRGLAISADGMKVAALCSEVVPIYSGDGGQSWTSGGSAPDWNGLVSSADGERLLTSVGTNLYYSQNGGGTWNTSFLSSGGSSWQSLGLSASGQVIIARDGNSTAHFTLNGGTTWSTLTGTYYQVNVSGDGSIFALGNASDDIVVTRDHGATFTVPRALDNDAPITDIALSSDGSRIIVASGSTYPSHTSGYLYLSTDSGGSFTALTAAGSRFWSSVACSSDGRVIVACVEENGYIHRSRDGGRT